MTISLNRFGRRLKTLSICVRAQTKPTLERAAKDEAILKADRFRNLLDRASWNRQAALASSPVGLAVRAASMLLLVLEAKIVSPLEGFISVMIG